MHPFEEYLHQNHLEALALAGVARVRYLTVYHAMKGQPIKVRDAEAIRQAAYRLCGVAYRGVFAIRVDNQPTQPIKRVLIKPS